MKKYEDKNYKKEVEDSYKSSEASTLAIIWVVLILWGVWIIGFCVLGPVPDFIDNLCRKIEPALLGLLALIILSVLAYIIIPMCILGICLQVDPNSKHEKAVIEKRYADSAMFDSFRNSGNETTKTEEPDDKYDVL